MTTIDIYVDGKGEHRWRLLSSNGNILADCAEGYKRQASLVKALDRIIGDLRSGKTKLRLCGKRLDPVRMQAVKDRLTKKLRG